MRHESSPATRFAGRAPSAQAPLVGRERELSELHNRWAQAKRSQGQTVLLSGVAGIGKSRVTESIRAAVESEATVIVHQCSPYFQNSTLYPFTSQLLRTAGIRRNDADDVKIEKLLAVLAETAADSARDLALIARLLGIPTREAPELERLTGERLLDDTIQVLLRRILVMSLKKPVLVLFEDAHWADPLSRRLVTSLSRALTNVPVMLLVTDRGGFTELSRLKGVTSMHLRSLRADEAYSIITHLAPSSALRRSLIDKIVTRSEGIPFFVEELTRAMLESPADSPGDVPPSLAALLMSRLDSVGPHKAMAQYAACIGNTFSLKMLRHITGLRPAQLAMGVRALVAADLVNQVSETDQSRFEFRHILLQEAAHESMLHSERRAVHVTIARKLERDEPERPRKEPELFAQHYDAAGELRLAAEHWLRAGLMAQDRSAHADAIAHLVRALRALKELPHDVQRDTLEIDTQSALARSRLAVEGWGGERVRAAHERVIELCRGLGERAREREFWWGLCVNLSTLGLLSEAGGKAAEYIGLAEQEEDSKALQMVHNAALLVATCRAQFAVARHHADAVRRYFSPMDAEHWLRVSAHDPLVLGSVYESLALWCQGLFDRSRTVSAQGVTRARALDHPFQLCHALLKSSLIAVFCEDDESALAYTDEALNLANEVRIPLFSCYGPLISAPALLGREPTESTVKWLEDCSKRMQDSGVQLHVPLYLGHLARAHAQLGALDAARERLERALLVIERTGECWVEPELLRISVTIDRAAGADPEAVEAGLKTALARAVELGTLGFRLRIACELGEHLAERGRRDEARPYVSEALAEFEEGGDVPLLRRAAAWLSVGVS